MIRRTTMAVIGLLMLFSLVVPLTTNAQNTSSTAVQPSPSSQQSTVGPLRKLRKKIRSMRPRIKRREARRKAMNGSTNSTSNTITPTTK